MRGREPRATETTQLPALSYTPGPSACVRVSQCRAGSLPQGCERPSSGTTMPGRRGSLRKPVSASWLIAEPRPLLLAFPRTGGFAPGGRGLCVSVPLPLPEMAEPGDVRATCCSHVDEHTDVPAPRRSPLSAAFSRRCPWWEPEDPREAEGNKEHPGHCGQRVDVGGRGCERPCGGLAVRGIGVSTSHLPRKPSPVTIQTKDTAAGTWVGEVRSGSPRLLPLPTGRHTGLAPTRPAGL